MITLISCLLIIIITLNAEETKYLLTPVKPAQCFTAGCDNECTQMATNGNPNQCSYSAGTEGEIYTEKDDFYEQKQLNLFHKGDCSIPQCPQDLNGPLKADMKVDKYCEADGNKAGTNNELNNCALIFDVYQLTLNPAYVPKVVLSSEHTVVADSSNNNVGGSSKYNVGGSSKYNDHETTNEYKLAFEISSSILLFLILAIICGCTLRCCRNRLKNNPGSSNANTNFSNYDIMLESELHVDPETELHVDP